MSLVQSVLDRLVGLQQLLCWVLFRWSCIPVVFRWTFPSTILLWTYAGWLKPFVGGQGQGLRKGGCGGGVARECKRVRDQQRVWGITLDSGWNCTFRFFTQRFPISWYLKTMTLIHCPLKPTCCRTNAEKPFTPFKAEFKSDCNKFEFVCEASEQNLKK